MSKIVFLFILVLGVSSFQYEEQTALKDWNLIQVAYCTDSFIKDWNCGDACVNYPNMVGTSVIFNEQWNLRGYVGYNTDENIFYIAFRGTVGSPFTQPQNILLDSDFLKTSYQYCQDCEVHKGFYDAFLDVQNSIVSSIQQLQGLYPQSSGLKIIGWSLGAAIAAHTAVYIKKENLIDIVGYTTFGQPRVGNQAFATYFNSLDIPNAVRVTHYHDPVPRLPPIFMNFFHTNREVWLNSDTENTYKVCAPIGEDKTCIDSVPIWDWNGNDHTHYMNVASTSVISCSKASIY